MPPTISESAEPDRDEPARVLVIAIQDADLDAALSETSAEGISLPMLSSLARSGGVQPLIAVPPGNHRSLWTTIATGVGADVHRVLTDEAVRSDGLGLRVPYASDRRAAAFWEFAAASNIPSACVNWPATHDDRAASPDATSIQGQSSSSWIVSDIFPIALARNTDDWPLPIGAAIPAPLLEDLAHLRLTARDLQADHVAAIMPGMEAMDLGSDDRAARAAVALASTCTTHNAATWLAEHRHSELLAVRYTLMTDIACLGDAIPAGTTQRCLQMLDMFIARLVALMGPRTHVIVIGSPPVTSSNPVCMITSGAGVRRDPAGRVDGERSILDVAPTIHALLGLEADAAYEGKSLSATAGRELRPATALSPRPRNVPSAEEIASTRAMTASLAALGYKTPHLISAAALGAMKEREGEALLGLIEHYSTRNPEASFRAWSAQDWTNQE